MTALTLVGTCRVSPEASSIGPIQAAVTTLPNVNLYWNESRRGLPVGNANTDNVSSHAPSERMATSVSSSVASSYILEQSLNSLWPKTLTTTAKKT